MEDGNGEERKDLAVAEAVEGVPMIPISELKRLTAYVNEVKKTLMVKGKDYVVDGNRQYTARSGFAKLAQGFRLSDDPPVIKTLYYDEPQTFEFDHYVSRQRRHEVITTNIRGFEAVVKVIQLDTGRYASGEGACTVEELHMTNNMSPKWYHRCLGTAKTRAWNRAVSNFVGSADVSAEEMGLVYDEEPQTSTRKKVDSEQETPERESERAPGIGPPPKKVDMEAAPVERQRLPKGVASLEELEYIFLERIPGYGELLDLVPGSDGFILEHKQSFDEEIEALVNWMVSEMGGERLKRAGLYGRDWTVPLKEAD